jgi:hypothetical protein
MGERIGSRGRRRGDRPGPTVERKCVALVSTAGDTSATVARDPDDGAIDAGVQVAAVVVVCEEGVKLGQEAA